MQSTKYPMLERFQSKVKDGGKRENNAKCKEFADACYALLKTPIKTSINFTLHSTNSSLCTRFDEVLPGTYYP